MKMSQKRIFIQRLPEKVTVEDLETEFARFGNVLKIDIKERKDFEQHAKSRFFAYVNVEIDDKNLQKCFNNFASNLWHGEYVELQISAESFLQRLQREREGTVTANEVVIKTKSIQPAKDNTESVNFEVVSNKEEVNTKPKRKKQTLKEEPRNPDKQMLVANTSVTQSELKRASSVHHMIQEYRQQKSIIQRALSNVDCKVNKKVLFTDGSDEQEVPMITEYSKNLSLFESEDEAVDGINFNVKGHFEGKKGQQLFQLQSQYKNDKRFLLDKRFMDMDNVEIEESEPPDISLEQEKKNEMEILQEILGSKQALQKPRFAQNLKNSMAMLRYDPTQTDHSKYELVTAEASNKVKKKKKESKLEPRLEAEVTDEVPEVSKNIFYKVNADLKEALKEQEGFSLLQMFGNAEESMNSGQSFKYSTKKIKSSLGDNPFQYDSSDDEGVDELKTKTYDATDIKESTTSSSSKPKLWSEPFFFRDDDYRLQEGVDFVKRIASESNVEFVQVRQNVKDIVKSKIRNNRRKSRPFKKKLGGAKMKKARRINKAMKK